MNYYVFNIVFVFVVALVLLKKNKIKLFSKNSKSHVIFHVVVNSVSARE